MSELKEAVICFGARTPIGKYRGALRKYSAVELGILAVKEVLSRASLSDNSGIVDELIMGQVLQAHPQFRNCG